MSGELTQKNIIQHEFVGLKATVIDSTDRSLLNRTGLVVDETMNTFRLEINDNGHKRCITIQKHRNTFKFSIPEERKAGSSGNEYMIINGSEITKRPEDRIKKLAKLVNKRNKKIKNTY